MSPGENSDQGKYNQMSVLSASSRVLKEIIFNRVIFNNFKNNDLVLQKEQFGLQKIISET